MSATQRVAQAEQEPAAACETDLSCISESLQRREDLLAATARASRLLLETPDSMAAIPDALRLLGEATSADRVCLTLARKGAAGEPLLILAAEWVDEDIEPYINDPAMVTKDERDHAEICLALRAGRSVCIQNGENSGGGVDLEHETRSKAIVPIFIDGEFFGMLAFDNTLKRKPIDSAEISTLETAAGVIGAALHRERLLETMRREREAAAEQRMAELARSNAAIRSNLERLSNDPDLRSFMSHVLLEAARQLEADAGAIVMIDDAKENWQLIACVCDGQFSEPPFAATAPTSHLALCEHIGDDRAPFYFDIEANASDLTWAGMLNYHRRQGHTALLVLPMIFGACIKGFLILAFRKRDPVAPQRAEVLIALAQQATLALELQRLADSTKHAAVLVERNRIGQEIHDGLAQAFTGILMQLGAAEELDAFDADSPLATIYTRIRDLARDGLAEARRSVMALHPERTNRAGLELALRQLAERSTVAGRVVCVFEGGGFVTGLRPEQEHELLRIAQEAVSNAVRHAQPRTVRIAMNEETFTWSLAVSDDGQGMEGDPEHCAQRGFGLTNMRERATAIGGEWQIRSLPGEGTRVNVRLLRRRAA